MFNINVEWNKYLVWNGSYLSFRKTKALSQLFPFSTDDVVILLKGMLQFQELRGRESGSYAFRLTKGL